MKATERFSNRVQNYIKYRPSYPMEMIEYLVSALKGTEDKICADIGSGTGILSRLLLPHFHYVYGVEPNDEMRLAGKKFLLNNRNFRSVKGTAENTNLNAESVDLVAAAQAFHWFDQNKFKTECRRILRSDGFVALIWNNRLTDTPFLVEYDSLLKQYATDYNEVNHQNITYTQLDRFYEGGFRKKSFPNHQRFDLSGMFGRLDSSSYAPQKGTDQYEILRAKLSSAFEKCSDKGAVKFNYETLLYIGRV